MKYLITSLLILLSAVCLGQKATRDVDSNIYRIMHRVDTAAFWDNEGVIDTAAFLMTLVDTTAVNQDSSIYYCYGYIVRIIYTNFITHEVACVNLFKLDGDKVRVPENYLVWMSWHTGEDSQYAESMGVLKNIRKYVKPN